MYPGHVLRLIKIILNSIKILKYTKSLKQLIENNLKLHGIYVEVLNSQSGTIFGINFYFLPQF